ncbi:MAG: hypothetical protein WBI55_09905 [Eubacteriales bacterium]|jgi:ABC-type Fe3+-hydroxamate transport system substrate-binding protein|nr:hypothetical protein [Clostridiales bacterium]
MKLLAILLIAALTLSITACTNEASQNDTDSIATTTDETNDIQVTENIVYADDDLRMFRFFQGKK